MYGYISTYRMIPCNKNFSKPANLQNHVHYLKIQPIPLFQPIICGARLGCTYTVLCTFDRYVFQGKRGQITGMKLAMSKLKWWGRHREYYRDSVPFSSYHV